MSTLDNPEEPRSATHLSSFNNSVRLKVQYVINVMIEYSAVQYFTGLPYIGLIEEILCYHLSSIQDRQLRIITELLRSRVSRQETLNFIYDKLSTETLYLLQSIAFTNGYVDSITRTKLVISVLIGFVASPANRSFIPYSADYPSRWNSLYARLLQMESQSDSEICHQHVTTATSSERGIALDFSNLPIFSHVQRAVNQPRPLY